MTAGHDRSDPQAGDAVALFLGLYLGHILGDFVFQPGRLVIAKRKNPRAAVIHTVIVTACTSLALAASLPRVWPAVLLVGIAHLGVERVTIRARRRSKMSSLGVFLFDQGLHLVLLVAIAALSGVSTEPVIGAWPVSLDLLAAVCGVATAAFAGSIFAFEVRLAREEHSGVTGEGAADPILGLDGSRLYGMAERGLALAAGLTLPVPALGALAFAPRVAYAVLSPPERRSEHLLTAGSGALLCAVSWTIVVMISRGN